MSFHSHNNSSGFTLLEFIVAISIGTIILGTVMSGQSKYTDAAALKGLVNEVSLNIRQAQIYGISIKQTAANSNDFGGSYGLSFNTASPASYMYFVDRGGSSGIYDGVYTSCTGVECLSLNPISRGNLLVSPMCRIANDNSETCDVGRADLTFIRPSTEAKIIYFNNSTGAIIPSTGIKGLRVKFISPRGLQRSVVVYTSGQISVQ